MTLQCAKDLLLGVVIDPNDTVPRTNFHAVLAEVVFDVFTVPAARDLRRAGAARRNTDLDGDALRRRTGIAAFRARILDDDDHRDSARGDFALVFVLHALSQRDSSTFDRDRSLARNWHGADRRKGLCRDRIRHGLERRLGRQRGTVNGKRGRCCQDAHDLSLIHI